MEETNSDGGGIAWLQDGLVRWKKGITAKTMLELIEKEKIKPPAFIHFRVSTVGGKPPELCHPFPISRLATPAVTGSASAVLMHNGHWSYWGNKVLETVLMKDAPVADGPWSDSRAMAYLVDKHGIDFLNMINGQRIAVLDKTGKMMTWGDWSQAGTREIYWSNTIWMRELNKSWQNKWDRRCNVRSFVYKDGKMVEEDDEAQKCLTLYQNARDGKESDVIVEALRQRWLAVEGITPSKEENKVLPFVGSVARERAVTIPVMNEEQHGALLAMYGLSL